MRNAHCALAVAVVLGCSSPRAPEPQSVAPAETVAIAPAALAPPVAPLRASSEPPPPAELREPAEVACRIEGTAWRSDQLRLRAAGPRFARADRVPTNLVVPVTTTPSEAIAAMDDGHVLVHAVLTRADVRLYAPKPTALLGIVTPAAHTNLIWARSAAGAVRVEVGTKGVLRAPQPFEADIACGDLAIVSASYNARDSITKKTNLPKRDVITAGAPLAVAPNGSAVAELERGLEVELVETRGGQARILAEHYSYVLSGWVSRNDLGPAQLRGYGTGTGRFAERGRSMGQMRLLHCPTDVGLFVELGSERVKVGLIHKDAGFRVKSEAGVGDAGEADAGTEEGVREIDLPESQWLLMEPNARLLVEAAALRSCRLTPSTF